ncbi:GAF domain-containing protein [Granulicella cerasi]|uniref:GAF domain-containing protein n=1 Tax=Granulicella cerasi TaxID=741063 RepID=A0ABW1ZEN0_9BACT
MNETDANQNELDDLRRQLAFMQEREELLGRINGSLRSLTDPEEIVRRAATFLGQHLAVNRCAYADVEGDQNTFNLFGDYNHGVPSMVGRYRFEDFSADCLAAMRAGEAFVVEDSETDPRLADVRENFRAAQIRSVVCVGLLKAGKFTAAMAIHSIEPRRWSEEEVEIVLSVANRCWESIERTRTLRELKKEREELIRRHSEIDKQRSEIESIYRTAPIGLALFDLDDYHYLRLNDRQAAFFGLKPEDVLGRTLMEMAPIPGLRELFDQVAQGGPHRQLSARRHADQRSRRFPLLAGQLLPRSRRRRQDHRHHRSVARDYAAEARRACTDSQRQTRRSRQARLLHRARDQ